MKKSLAVIFLLVIFMGIASPAAQGGDRQDYNWSVELRSGVYWPNVDEWEEVYGRKVGFLTEIHLRRQLLPRLEVGGSVGFLVESGHGRTSSGEASDQDFTLFLVPLQVEGVYLFDFLPEQLLVPYVKAGLDLWLFLERGDDSRDWSGTKGGYHGGGGLLLLLDRLDPEGARNFLRSTGIVNSYIVMDARYANVDNFGSSDLDLSGWIFQAGLMFQF
ncbi:MAG: hypothetical protein JRG73_02545 [Deltaproteobacteria bacterium]|nr:hypothetical protein [Deltaproteobacteria bacterium]MBW2305790.1 hypothetical protein [Deltaproteobacteria bacterium]